MIRGFALTVSGVPHVFATAGVVAMPTSTDGRWFGAESGVELAAGFLAHENLRWSERAKPLDGSTEVDAITFRLRDARVQTGLAAGYHLLTYLATLDASSATSTPLSATVTASATALTVGSGSALSGASWVWLNREAMAVTSIVSNTVNVTRGALGTKAVAHVVAEGVYPEVYKTVPWVQRRKVVLWAVEDGVATALWAGFCVRAPKLSSDGATFDLACDPYLQVVSAAPIGSSSAVTRLVGYGETSRSAPAWGANVLGVQVQCATHLPAVASSYRTARTWEEMVAGVTARLATATTNRGHLVNCFISRVGNRGRIEIDDTSHTFSAGVWWLGEAVSSELVPSRNRGSNREFVSLEFGPIPAVAYVFTDGAPVRLAVTSTDALPTTWGVTTEDSGTDYTTTYRSVLRTAIDGERWVDFYLAQIGSTGDALTPWLDPDGLEIVPRKWGLPARDGSEVYVLKDPPPLTTAVKVTTRHWAWGMRRAAIRLVDDAEDDDWDWSTLPAVVQATVGNAVARTWTFDGRRTLGDLLRECCILSGVTPTLRNGRVALHPWAWPRSGQTPDATLTAADVIGTPVWSTWDDGLANHLTFRSGDLVADITDAGSVARYGPAHEITVTLAGLDQQAPLTDDPQSIARQALGRLNLWADPLPSVQIVVSLRHLSLRIGSLVVLSDWITPNGAGSRGITSRKGIVYGRTVDFDEARVTLDILLFPRVSYGYAPCARVLSVVSSTVVDIDATPIGSFDYAGGTDGLGGTGTGSQSLFAVGDRVELLTRDATTLTAEDRVISAITWTGTDWRITFTVALSAGMQTAIGAGPVDIRGSAYATSGLTAAQKDFMHVADDATLVIDGTADRARVIAP